MKRFAVLATALVAGAGVIGIGANVAYGHGGSAGQVHACVGSSGYLVRIVGADEACPRGMTALDWNVEGPAGPAGPAGPEGPAGPPGAVGGPGGAPSAVCPVDGGLEPSTGPGVAAFARFEGIEGGSGAEGHEGETDLVCVRVGVDASGEPDRPPAAIDNMVLTMHTDPATVPLVEQAVTGQLISEVDITLEREQTGDVFLHYELRDVSVVRTRTAWAGGVPTEEIALSFGQILWEYIPTTPQGTPAPIRFCWEPQTQQTC